MQTTAIIRLPYQAPSIFERLKLAQQESAKVWNECMEAHKIREWLNGNTAKISATSSINLS
jgi:hypothetical protein